MQQLLTTISVYKQGGPSSIIIHRHYGVWCCRWYHHDKLLFYYIKDIVKRFVLTKAFHTRKCMFYLYDIIAQKHIVCRIRKERYIKSVCRIFTLESVFCYLQYYLNFHYMGKFNVDCLSLQYLKSVSIEIWLQEIFCW